MAPCYRDCSQIFQKQFNVERAVVLGFQKQIQANVFDYIRPKRAEAHQKAEREDKDFVEMSLTLLDERLKAYYPLKGKIQTGIYLLRAGEITQHKRK